MNPPQRLGYSVSRARGRSVALSVVCGAIQSVDMMGTNAKSGQLYLEDGSIFQGNIFGFPSSVSGEVVFNTGMVGYAESLTDPSYKGQILVFTYPLIGNYGVPSDHTSSDLNIVFESGKVQVAGLIVADVTLQHNHWHAVRSLPHWLAEQRVPVLSGVDVRALTKLLRERGSLLGKIAVGEECIEFHDPNRENLVSQVSVKEPRIYPGGQKRVVVIDCGCKNSIIRSLVERGVSVIRVPWDYDFLGEKFDGVLISNGPGDPKVCVETIVHVRQAMGKGYPIFGICLGHQILALAAGGNTYKLKFGHRSQNQPCREVGTRKCHITSQNHGFAVDSQTLSIDWEPWFINANDGTNEGMRHRSRPFMSVQFHPEARPGPVDTNFLFDKFLGTL